MKQQLYCIFQFELDETGSLSAKLFLKKYLLVRNFEVDYAHLQELHTPGLTLNKCFCTTLNSLFQKFFFLNKF